MRRIPINRKLLLSMLPAKRSELLEIFEETALNRCLTNARRAGYKIYTQDYRDPTYTMDLKVVTNISDECHIAKPQGLM